ncbi:MAG: hypothetical protein HYS57_01210 [Parcubacteria group bacterium]|nr:hypothetical protein [Parcubacteria group bacterium]
MLGVFLIALGTFFGEVGTSLGKVEVARKEQDLYSFGFLSLFLSTIVFVLIAIFVRGEFIFSFASLPTISIRALLEILQMVFSIKAITLSDRSTYGFVRVFTIPLLLLVDVALGYPFLTNQIIGVAVVVVSILLLFFSHGLRAQGIGWVLLSTVNAVLTLSLFKYDITYFNSVEVEQSIIQLILLVYFAVMVRRTSGENPLSLLRKPLFFFQSSSQAVAGVLISFGYPFMPASVATGVERATAVFFSVLSGHRYFREKKLIQKLITLLLLVVGFAFLAGFAFSQ